MNMNPQDWKDVLNNAGKWSIAILIIAAACYQAITQGKIDPVIVGIVFSIIGYYFGNSQKTEVK